MPRLHWTFGRGRTHAVAIPDPTHDDGSRYAVAAVNPAAPDGDWIAVFCVSPTADREAALRAPFAIRASYFAAKRASETHAATGRWR